jgi:hypothetical protein
MFTIDFIFVLLSHTYFPICSQFVFNVFSMCSVVVSFLPCRQIKLFLQFSYVPSICSHTLCQIFLVLFPEFPFTPRVIPAVPTHPHVVPNSLTAASSNVSSTQFEF